MVFDPYFEGPTTLVTDAAQQPANLLKLDVHRSGQHLCDSRLQRRFSSTVWPLHLSKLRTLVASILDCCQHSLLRHAV